MGATEGRGACGNWETAVCPGTGSIRRSKPAWDGFEEGKIVVCPRMGSVLPAVLRETLLLSCGNITPARAFSPAALGWKLQKGIYEA